MNSVITMKWTSRLNKPCPYGFLRLPYLDAVVCVLSTNMHRWTSFLTVLFYYFWQNGEDELKSWCARRWNKDIKVGESPLCHFVFVADENLGAHVDGCPNSPSWSSSRILHCGQLATFIRNFFRINHLHQRCQCKSRRALSTFRMINSCLTWEMRI